MGDGEAGIEVGMTLDASYRVLPGMQEKGGRAGYRGRDRRWTEAVLGLSVEVVRKPKSPSPGTWPSDGPQSGPRLGNAR